MTHLITTRLADRLFAAHYNLSIIVEEFNDTLVDWLGFDPDGDWPYDDTTYDPYDRSFELKGADPGLRFTPEFLARAWEAGFACIWICHKDGWETFYSPSANGVRSLKVIP